MAEPDPVQPLREAMRLSPDNLPLRLHLARTLLDAGRADEAEVEFRVALDQQDDNVAAKLGLARTFLRQGKRSPAMVVAEELAKAKDVPPAVGVDLAALLLRLDLEDDAKRVLGDAAKADRSLRKDPKHKKLFDQLDPGGGRGGYDDNPFLDPEHFGEDDIPFDLPHQYFDDEEDDEEDIPFGDGRDRRQRNTWEGGADDAIVDVEKPTLTFDDVGGLDELKAAIRMKIILPMEQPEMFAAYGKKAGGGMLLYGPPGCGKTYLARATAGETKRRFIAVGINDVLDMYIGNSEKQLHALFEQARRRAPCVLFFDEVDALAASRADMRTSGGRHLINQFLAELDGAEANNEGLLILAATNAPWHVDPAFRRPGRFDKVQFVPPPDGPARAAILRAHLKDKPQEGVDVDKVAAKTEGFSGADLKAVVDGAVEAKLEAALKSGKIQAIGTKDLLAAAKGHRPSTKEWFSTARNHALYANDAGQYDEIVKYLKM